MTPSTGTRASVSPHSFSRGERRREGRAILITDSGRLEDYGIVEGDTLNLIAKEPEVDG